MQKKEMDFDSQVERAFKPNDVRGVYGRDITEEIAYRVGRAMPISLKTKEIIVGFDMRISSDSLLKAFAKGITDSGATVINIGRVDTPSVYFASGYFKKTAAMITASHNPKEYNGIKIVKAGAVPISAKTGLAKIKKLVKINNFPKTKKGKIIKKNISKLYRRHVHSFIDIKKLRKIKVVIDGANGMTGKIAPIIYKGLPVKIIPLGFRLDGTFPMHNANPAVYKNIRDLQKRVVKEKADFGMAFDGDMDRVFFIDEQGRILNSSLSASLLIKNLLKCGRENKIICNEMCSKIVLETIKKYGGRGIHGKTGHAFIKAKMRKTNAKFAAEHSGHYYYKKDYYADSGIITSLIMCEIYCKQNYKFSDLIEEFNKYYKSEEKGVKLKNKQEVINKIEKHYKKKKPKCISKTDGLTVEFKDYWFNLRPSSTEPFMRINIESTSRKVMIKRRKEILSLIHKWKN